VLLSLEWFVVIPARKLPQAFYKPHIVGHNGAGDNYPEDTIEALDIAVNKYGCTILEVDVQLTKDKHLVCIHDVHVDRTTNGTGLVSNLTLAEIQKLDAAFKYPQYVNKGVRIPSLQEVVDWFLKQKQEVLLLIEMKPKTTSETVTHVQKFFASHPILYERAIVSAFEPNALYKLRTLDEKISTALISAHMLVSGGCLHKVLPLAFCDAAVQYGVMPYLDQFALMLTKTIVPHIIGNGGFILHMNATTPTEATQFMQNDKWIDIWGIKDAETMKNWLKVGASVAPDILYKLDD